MHYTPTMHIWILNATLKHSRNPCEFYEGLDIFLFYQAPPPYIQIIGIDFLEVVNIFLYLHVSITSIMRVNSNHNVGVFFNSPNSICIHIQFGGAILTFEYEGGRGVEWTFKRSFYRLPHANTDRKVPGSGRLVSLISIQEAVSYFPQKGKSQNVQKTKI